MKKTIQRGILVLLALLCTSFIIIESLIIIEGKRSYHKKVDYLVLLGAKTYKDKPSDSLLERLKTANEYLNKHKNVKVVVSGGKGTNDNMAEADVMKKYLVDRGIDENRIIVENKSSNTFENLSFSLEEIKEADGVDDYEDIKFLIGTNSYHIFRSKMLAGRLGIEAYGLPAQTPEVTMIKSYLREYLAVIKSLILDR